MKKLIKIISITSISSLFFISAMNAHAKIYKWTDANGQTHYTAQPPAQNKKIKAKNIEDEIQAFAGKYRPPANSDKTTSTEQDEDSNESKSEEELAGPNKQLIKYCDSQRNNLKQLRKNFRNVWIDVKGKKTNLNQDQRKEKVAALESQIKENCSDVQTASKS